MVDCQVWFKACGLSYSLFLSFIALALATLRNALHLLLSKFATCMRSLLRTTQCCHGRFCKLRETIAIAFAICGVVHCVCSFEHTASSRLRLRVRGRHCDRSGDSRKRKDIAVAFCKLCGLIAVAFAIRNTFIVAAFVSTRHRRNHICDLRNHLRSLLATRGIHRDRFSARSRTHRDHSCEVAGKRRAWLSSVLVAEADGAKS